MHKNIFIILNITLITTTQAMKQKAVVIVPVADLVGQPLYTTTNVDVAKRYEQLPFCGAKRAHIACPRIHQLLYNDIVTVLKTTEHEAYISIKHATYYLNGQPQTNYWIFKKNLLFLQNLKTKNINLEHIPEPIDYTDTLHSALQNKNIITLTQPYHDKKTNITFSAGTRFVRASLNDTTIRVYITNYNTFHTNIITIPKHKCIIGSKQLSPSQRIANYVTLLREWIHNAHGSIAYTWGGTSFISTTNGSYSEITKWTPYGEYSYYDFKNYKNKQKTGFDCSGAVLRAAQICGIPYFCKNSSSITHDLRPLSIHEKLEVGDLFIIPGHVMIVSDIQKNLLIESRGYSNGYGKLHEAPLSDFFDNTKNYTDLVALYHNKKLLTLKSKTEISHNSSKPFMLFKMSSVWK